MPIILVILKLGGNLPMIRELPGNYQVNNIYTRWYAMVQDDTGKGGEGKFVTGHNIMWCIMICCHDTRCGKKGFRFYKCLKMLKYGCSILSLFLAAKNDQNCYQATKNHGGDV